jgi:hypothetical protein
LRKRAHWHPDYTIGQCLLRGGLNPFLLRQHMVDSKTDIRYPVNQDINQGVLNPSGWHLRSFLSMKSWRNKLASFSEADFASKKVTGSDDKANMLRKTCKHACVLLAPNSERCGSAEKTLGINPYLPKTGLGQGMGMFGIPLPVAIERDIKETLERGGSSPGRYAHLLDYHEEWPESIYTDPKSPLPPAPKGSTVTEEQERKTQHLRVLNTKVKPDLPKDVVGLEERRFASADPRDHIPRKDWSAEWNKTQGVMSWWKEDARKGNKDSDGPFFINYT